MKHPILAVACDVLVHAELAVWRGLTLRAEYQAVDVSEGDFEIVSAGVAYKF